MDTAILPDVTNRTPTHMRLSDEARRILDGFARRLGISRAAVVELALRQLEEQRLRLDVDGIEPDDLEET